jgi:hypothetical protein
VKNKSIKIPSDIRQQRIDREIAEHTAECEKRGRLYQYHQCKDCQHVDEKPSCKAIQKGWCFV